MPKPSIDKILEDAEYVKKHYSEAHKEFDTDFKYLTRKFSVDVPKDVSVIYPPTAQNAIDTVRDHVPTLHPRIDVPKASPGEQGQAHADKLQKFYTGLIYRTAMESMDSPFDIAVEHLATHNMGVLKIIYRPFKKDSADAEAAEMQKRLFLPIVISAIHPRNFYPDPSEFPEFVMEIYQRSAADIKRKYPRFSGGGDHDVEWIEWYDNRYRCCLADKEPVLKTGVETHGYGFIPHSWGYAHYGLHSADGEPSYQAEGLLRPRRGMLEEQAYLWSVNHEINKALGWPTTYLFSDEAAIPTLERKPGKIILLPAGTKIQTDQPGPAAQGVLTELQLVTGELTEGMAPRSVRGLSESGVRSGYERSLMVMESRLKYGSVASALGYISARILGHAARLLETQKSLGEMTVWGKLPERGEFEETIKGEDVKGHYICYVEFAPAEMEDEYRRANTGTLGYERGILSRGRTREKYFGIIDPVEEETQVLTDKLTDAMMPVMAQLLQQELMQEIAARQIKEGVIPPPEQMGQPPMGQPAGQVRPFEQRALPGSPTGAPFVAEQPKPFSPEEGKQILRQQLGKLREQP